MKASALLNASPTENIQLARAGHRFTVLALDGDPVPTSAMVDVLALAPAGAPMSLFEMNSRARPMMTER